MNCSFQILCSRKVLHKNYLKVEALQINAAERLADIDGAAEEFC